MGLILMKYHKVNGAKLTNKQFKWLKKKAGKKGFTSKEASKLLTKAMSTPRMGGTRNKMYKYKPGEQPDRSIPAMGSKASGFVTLFKSLGKVGKSTASALDQDDYTGPQFEQRDPNKERETGPPLSKKEIIANFRTDKSRARKVNSLANKPGMSVGRKISVPRMGPVGAAGGAYVGRKLGSWIGSAGKLIGKKHEKYGRQAGEYIGGSVGGVFGGLLAPI